MAVRPQQVGGVARRARRGPPPRSRGRHRPASPCAAAAAARPGATAPCTCSRQPWPSSGAKLSSLRHPGQALAGDDAARLALAEGAVGIGDADLRDQPEEGVPADLEAGGDRQQPRQQPAPHQPAAEARATAPRKTRSVVSTRRAGEADALGLVGVEDGRDRPGRAAPRPASRRGSPRRRCRCSCPGRRPGCGCARRRRRGRHGPGGRRRRRGGGRGRWRTSSPARRARRAAPRHRARTSSKPRPGRSPSAAGTTPISRFMPRLRTGSISAKPPRLAQVDAEVGLEGAGEPDIGDVEELAIGAAGEAEAERLAHPAMRAVAAAEIGARRLPSRPPSWRSVARMPCGVLGEAGQLGVPLDRDAGRLQALDQEALVVVLRVAEGEGVGAQPLRRCPAARRGRPRRRPRAGAAPPP